MGYEEDVLRYIHEQKVLQFKTKIRYQLKPASESFAMQTYHKLVAESMIRGIKYLRYTRNGDSLTVSNLRLQASIGSGCICSVSDKECADRFERWFKWMKGGVQ